MNPTAPWLGHADPIDLCVCGAGGGSCGVIPTQHTWASPCFLCGRVLNLEIVSGSVQAVWRRAQLRSNRSMGCWGRLFDLWLSMSDQTRANVAAARRARRRRRRPAHQPSTASTTTTPTNGHLNLAASVVLAVAAVALCAPLAPKSRTARRPGPAGAGFGIIGTKFASGASWWPLGASERGGVRRAVQTRPPKQGGTCFVLLGYFGTTTPPKQPASSTARSSRRLIAHVK